MCYYLPMTLFFYGCNCGELGKSIKKVKRWALQNHVDFNLKNSKYSEENRNEHSLFLALSDISTDQYLPIVVVGDQVTELSAWKP